MRRDGEVLSSSLREHKFDHHLFFFKNFLMGLRIYFVPKLELKGKVPILYPTPGVSPATSCVCYLFLK
jgi:hypothetical protein